MERVSRMMEWFNLVIALIGVILLVGTSLWKVAVYGIEIRHARRMLIQETYQVD